MKKTHILSSTLLAAVIGAAAFGAQAAEQPGFYAGFGAGQASVDEGMLDDEDTAFSVFGGYQANQYFGIEAGYADFGKLEPRGLPGKVEADTAYLTAVGTLPFTGNFSGYAKAGFHVWDAEARLPGVARAKTDGTDPTYGLGLQYRFTDTVALRGEYSRFEMDDVDVDLAQLQLRFDF